MKLAIENIQAFLDQAAAYEQEIIRLKDRVRGLEQELAEATQLIATLNKGRGTREWPR